MRQPVQTLYGGAHLYKAGTCRKLGEIAQRTLAEHAPDASTLASTLGMPSDLAEIVYPRIVEKLAREPIADYRIDFEDGYGYRPDAEEDAAAAEAARQLVLATEAGALPPFIGIRIKSLGEQSQARSLQTLKIFLDELGGRVPPNFVVTLPKVTSPPQVEELSKALGPLPMELMVETPQAVLQLRAMVDAAQMGCRGAHFGPYDYAASLGIAASQQQLHHPVCDFARSMMLLALAGTGVWLSDGPTTILPIGAANVHAAWKLHYDQVRHSLHNGFYQGWDLHPAQLVTRYAAVYGFFLEGLAAASTRLRNFLDEAGKATRIGMVFDDAATGEGLLNYVLRAINSGAVTESDASQQTGLTVEELRSASFVTILNGRKGL